MLRLTYPRSPIGRAGSGALARAYAQPMPMSEDTVLWSMTCGACDHEWMQTTPEGSDPAAEEIECPACGSTLLDAAYVGKS